MTLLNALNALVRDDQRLDWDAWYPIAQASLNDPQALIDAVSALSHEDQYAVLDALKADSGPLADFLLVTMASRPDIFDDEQIRAYVLLDSTEALERRQSLLAQLAENLRVVTGKLAERRQSGFDVANEVAALEQERNRLRAQQLESGHQEMTELEWEIARLEILRSRLASYDPAKRRVHRDELRVEADRLEAERRDVEETVAQALRSRDAEQIGLDEAQLRLTSVAEQISNMRAQHAGLTTDIETVNREVAELHSYLASVIQQSTALIDERQRLEQRLRAEESRLEQLRSSPLADAAERLRNQIGELWQQLPSDDAEAMFTPNLGRRA